MSPRILCQKRRKDSRSVQKSSGAYEFLQDTDSSSHLLSFRKMVKAPVVCYADFETSLKPMTDIDTTTGVYDSAKKEKHVLYQQHNPASYFTKVVSIDPNFQLDQEQDFQFPQRDAYVGEDCVTHFLDYMTKVADKTYDRLFGNPSEMIFTPENKRQHEAATECHICQKRYSTLRAFPHAHRPEDDCSQCEMCISPDQTRNFHCG